MRRSFRAELLIWLLSPLVVVVGLNSWTSFRSARDSANLTIDHLLLSSARVISENVRDEDGHIDIAIPPSAMEIFASGDRDRVLYRVLGPNGGLIAGTTKNLMPPTLLDDLQPVFFETRIDGQKFRAVALTQPILSINKNLKAEIILATTLGWRDRMITDSWLHSLVEQALLVGVAAIVSVIGLQNGLKPLMRLRAQLIQRDEYALRPVSSEGVQTEIAPLVKALNQSLERVSNYVDLQRRFVADASHQLRTPLAVLKTQASVGLRETDAQAKDESLRALSSGVDQLARMTNQLLTLARAESQTLTKDKTNLVALARSVLERLSALAIQRRIDLSFDCVQEEIFISGHPLMLQEMIANLIENALRYSPEQGWVNLTIDHHAARARLAVRDNGPGVPVSERDKIFDRFHRVSQSTVDGTGLGLAIVKEVVQAHGGTIQVSDATASGGLLVEVMFPLWSQSSLTGTKSFKDEPSSQEHMQLVSK